MYSFRSLTYSLSFRLGGERTSKSINMWDSPSFFVVLFIMVLVGPSVKCLETSGTRGDYELSIRMPNAVSEKPDQLVCTGVKVAPEEAYIVKYTPHASKTTAHHMMVYGCEEPANDNKTWTCNASDSYRSDRSVCANGKERQILFAWAMDAPAKALPEGVGFRIAGGTPIRHIIIQIHYARRFSDGETDNSGVTLSITHQRPPQQMSYYVLGSIQSVAPQKKETHIESGCQFGLDYTIYPIGYRTHSHNLGVVTSGYRIRDGIWTEMGRMSPQLPETFYNISNPGIDVRRGDILAARCTMNSMTRTDYTRMGPRNQDEMCNFYIMYSTYNQENLITTYCFSNGEFSWARDLQAYLPPPHDASSLDGIHNAASVREKFNMTLTSH